MVEIPDEVFARHVITQALEVGEWGDVHDTASEGQYGQHSFDTEWSLNDLDPEKCDVDMESDDVVHVSGEVEAEYSVQVTRAKRNPPGKAHPAEYERRTMPLHVIIEMDLSEAAPRPIIHAEPW